MLSQVFMDTEGSRRCIDMADPEGQDTAIRIDRQDSALKLLSETEEAMLLRSRFDRNTAQRYAWPRSVGSIHLLSSIIAIKNHVSN